MGVATHFDPAQIAAVVVEGCVAVVHGVAARERDSRRSSL